MLQGHPDVLRMRLDEAADQSGGTERSAIWLSCPANWPARRDRCATAVVRQAPATVDAPAADIDQVGRRVALPPPAVLAPARRHPPRESAKREGAGRLASVIANAAGSDHNAAQQSKLIVRAANSDDFHVRGTTAASAPPASAARRRSRRSHAPRPSARSART